MSLLYQDDLHPALQHSSLQIAAFHTEVFQRYPDAVSFAPGAPNLAFAQDFEVAPHVDRFLEYLRSDRGLSADAARHLLYEYGPSKGIINELVAAALRRDQGISVAPHGIVITVGAQEGMLLIMRALRRDRNDMLAVVNPCFVGMVGAARLVDAEVVSVDETDGGLDVERLEQACQEARSAGRRIRALYLAPDHSNPSGTVLDLAARRRLLQVAAEQDFLLIEDGTYAFTTPPGQEVPTLKALDQGAGRVISIGTFAKVCLPGARVGFVVADQKVRAANGTERLLAQELAALKSMTTLNTPAISQAVVGGMILEHGGSIVELGRKKSDLYRRNLGLLLDALDRRLSGAGALPGVSWNRPQGGFFVRMRLPVVADAALLEASASKFGVLWTPMSQFHLDGSGRNEIRLSCSYLDPEEIDEGVVRLERFLRHLCP